MTDKKNATLEVHEDFLEEDPKCNKCGAEANIKFGGCDVTPNWWCKECLNKEFPQFRHIFEHAEGLVEEMEDNLSKTRTIH